MFLCTILSTTALATHHSDQCSQYASCGTCLNVTAIGSNGSVTGPTDLVATDLLVNSVRKDCGWCHTPIVYSDGTVGKQCADLRDHPWKCGSVLDEAMCTAWYVCDDHTGTCTLSKPGAGQGFPTMASCHVECGHR
jgi:hypothetical protein